MSVLATAVLEGANLLGVTNLLNPTTGDYAIVDNQTSQVVVTPDTVVGFEYRGEQRVADFPVEQGGFSSYNKVAVPFDIRLVLACGGLNYFQSAGQALDNVINSILGTGFGQPMDRPAFLAALDVMLQSTDLYDIVTPDKTYENVNLVHVNYRKQAKNQATMILAELYFREIRVTASAIYSTGGLPSIQSNSPSAANPVGVGTVTASIPAVTQTSIIDTGGFV